MNATVNKYLVGGIVLKTAIEFPEFIPTDLPHDTVVEYGKVPEELEGSNQFRALVSVNHKDQLLFIMPNVARFLVDGTQKVTIELEDESKKNDAEKFMLSFILGMLSYKIGFFPLHGGGVVHNGEAYLFTGKSGAGKSTVIAALQQKGFEVIGDDIANLFVKNGQVFMHPCFPRLLLWEDTLDLLKYKNQGEYILKSGMNKYLIPIENSFQNQPIPVKRIYHLRDDKEKSTFLKAIKGYQKMNSLKANSFKPWAVQAFGLQKSHYNLMNEMITSIEWVEFNRPKDKKQFPDMLTTLINDIKNE